MDRQKVARQLVSLARKLVARRDSYKLKKDMRTKKGVEFQRGESVRLDEYVDKRFMYFVRVVADDGRKLMVPVERAHMVLVGFPKPPSERTMMRWNSDGVAETVDGQRIEPDGVASNGAPSWFLALGLI